MVHIIILVFLILISFLIALNTILEYKKSEKEFKIKEKELKNKKYEIFNSIDIDGTKKIVDDMINDYIDRYALYKFIANNIPYIREPDQNEMIKNVTKNIMLDISELYIYYISLITSIDTDEDLTRFIHTKVKNYTISFVSNYNKAKVEPPKTKLLNL